MGALGKHKDEPLYRKKVALILKQIYECVLFLRWYADKGFGGILSFFSYVREVMFIHVFLVRLIRDLVVGADDAIKTFEKAFKDLLTSLQDIFAADLIRNTYQVVAMTEHIATIGLFELLVIDTGSHVFFFTAEDERLDRMPGATLFSVEYDKHKACLAGTRTELLNDIEQWIHSEGECERILWLAGPAGTGKSSVANSVAQKMDSLGRLAASFRFDRGQAERTPGMLIGNLCRQMARFHNSIKGSMLAAVERYGPGGSMPCASQAAKLFVDPILDANIVGPILIVIDAIDESGKDDPFAGGTSRKDLVTTIVTEFIRLPSCVKVLITSREEGCIIDLMPGCQSCRRLPIADTHGVEGDIQRFIETEMGDIRNRGPDWPGVEMIQMLTQYANGLFIWAAVACNLVKNARNPDLQMKKIPHTRRLDALNSLYMTVVTQSLVGIESDSDERNNWIQVIGTIAAVREPLTVVEMDALLGLPTESLETTLDYIDSLLPLLKKDGKEKVQLLHKSVFDFLTTQTTIPIDVPRRRQDLAVDCLTYMNRNLRYDMSWISVSESNPGTGSNEGCNTSALRYACRNFSQHLSESTCQHPALPTSELGIFLRKHLLHWFEVMAWLKGSYEAEESLKLLSTCLSVSSDSDYMNCYANEIRNFHLTMESETMTRFGYLIQSHGKITYVDPRLKNTSAL